MIEEFNTHIEKRVANALDSYRCQYSKDIDGDAVDLVDMLTPMGADNISDGIREMELLAEHITMTIIGGDAWAVLDAGWSRNELLGVVAKESFLNCPVHDGGTYTGMEKVHNFESLQNMVINGLNREHVKDMLSFDGHEYNVKYEVGGHSYIGIAIYIDRKKVCYTEDNGSGKLRWVNT